MDTAAASERRNSTNRRVVALSVDTLCLASCIGLSALDRPRPAGLGGQATTVGWADVMS